MSKRSRIAASKVKSEQRRIALLLPVLTFAVFAQVHGHEFVDYDDVKHIVKNPDVAAGVSADAIARVFSQPHFGDFIPLTYVSLQVDRTLFGPGAAGTLLGNVALHAASAVLLFLALAQMSGATWRSAFVAAVFAVHPLHVESVAWAFERKDVLSGFFWMLALFFYARRVRVGRLFPVAASLIAGLLAKPMLVTLPFALLLLDYWPLERLRRAGEGALPDAKKLAQALLEKWTLFAIAAVWVLVTLVRHESASFAGATRMPLGVRLLHVPISYVFYVWKSFWPTGLAVYYPPAFDGPAAGSAALATLGLLAATVLALRLAARCPYLITGWLWYLGTLVPVVGFLQIGLHVRADRYSYLPQIGLAWMVAWGAVDVFGRTRAARRGLAAVAVAAVLALAAASWLQVRYWQNTITLFEHALAVTGDNFLAHWRLGVAYARNGQQQQAIEQLGDSVRIEPDLPETQVELAGTLEVVGERDAAVAHYERALSLDPDHAGANARYGTLLVNTGRLDAALPFLERALAVDNNLPRAHSALAQVYAERGRAREAALHYREALRLEPGYPPTVNNFALLLATTTDDAVRDPSEALRLAEGVARGPGERDPVVLDTLAAAHAAAGHLEQAIDIAERAAELAEARGDEPLHREIQSNLGRYRSELRGSKPSPRARAEER